MTRVAVIRDSAITGGIGQWASIQSMAPSLSVEVIPVNMHDAAEIERAVTAFARGANGGLILTASGSAFVHYDLIIALAARHKLPAVYFERFFVAKGGRKLNLSQTWKYVLGADLNCSEMRRRNVIQPWVSILCPAAFICARSHYFAR